MKIWTGLKSHKISLRAWFGIDLLTSWAFGEECSCVLMRIENSKEQEEQIIADREAELKVNRHWSRRKAVSTCY